MAVVARRDYSTETSKQRIVYSDFAADFSADVTSNFDVSRVTNEDSVKESIKNLLLTRRGERLFNPTLGSDIEYILFENASPAMEKVLEDLIRTTIDNYEPRARILDVVVTSDEEYHLISATIVFSIINKQDPIVLDLILNRIR